MGGARDNDVSRNITLTLDIIEQFYRRIIQISYDKNNYLQNSAKLIKENYLKYLSSLDGSLPLKKGTKTVLSGQLALLTNDGFFKEEINIQILNLIIQDVKETGGLLKSSLNDKDNVENISQFVERMRQADRENIPDNKKEKEAFSRISFKPKLTTQENIIIQSPTIDEKTYFERQLIDKFEWLINRGIMTQQELLRANFSNEDIRRLSNLNLQIYISIHELKLEQVRNFSPEICKRFEDDKTYNLIKNDKILTINQVIDMSEKEYDFIVRLADFMSNKRRQSTNYRYKYSYQEFMKSIIDLPPERKNIFIEMFNNLEEQTQYVTKRKEFEEKSSRTYNNESLIKRMEDNLDKFISDERTKSHLQNLEEEKQTTKKKEVTLSVSAPVKADNLSPQKFTPTHFKPAPAPEKSTDNLVTVAINKIGDLLVLEMDKLQMKDKQGEKDEHRTNVTKCLKKALATLAKDGVAESDVAGIIQDYASQLKKIDPRNKQLIQAFEKLQKDVPKQYAKGFKK